MSFIFRGWLIWLSVALLLLALLSQQVMANVINNVTFTVKSNGSIEAYSDIGQFDINNEILTINEASMPNSFKDNTVSYAWGYASTELNPVGYQLISSEQHAPSIILRLLSTTFRVSGRWAWDNISRIGNCDGGTMANKDVYVYTDTTSITNINMSCVSNQVDHGATVDHFDFYATSIRFVFSDIINELKKSKIPSGTYTYRTAPFQITNNVPNFASFRTTTKVWSINTKVIVEASIAAVEMPASLPLDVTMAAPNKLEGKGTVMATVTGALGKHLKIEPRSSNGGKLVKGAEQIPYTLSVTPLSGDNTPRLLIDGNGSGAQPPVTIETFARRDQYRLRFDAGFATPTTGLTSGRFSDTVTLIFTTPDLP